jgi:hypothetical protein
MHSPTTKILTGAIIGTLALTSTAHPAFAGGGTGDSSTPATSPAQTNSEIPPAINSSSPQPIIPLQVNQQSISWSSSLTPPSCPGGCFFAVTRAAPASYGSGTNLEAMVGVTIPLGSSDGGVGEVNRLNAEMQKHSSEHQMRLTLSEQLAEALDRGDMQRAKLAAMSLAPLLGYKDYQLLINTVVTPRASNHGQLLGLTPISVSVMF